MILCEKPMRDGPCNMPADHRGRHTTRAWECDGCGKYRRSQPNPVYDFRADEVVGTFCFMCVGGTAFAYARGGVV